MTCRKNLLFGKLYLAIRVKQKKDIGKVLGFKAVDNLFLSLLNDLLEYRLVRVI